MTDSRQLLAEFARNGSDAAFRELVARYINLVYSTALRLVGGDTHRAKDVAQTAFIDLARKARTISEDVMLGGWLHRHTCFVAANLMRGERRRQIRERQAVEMNALHANSGPDFPVVAPILDEAINELGEADRTAILLRFFEQRDFRSVGEALGGNEDAARMRVTCALDKLEVSLKRRGVTTTAAGLGAALAGSAVQAAPAGLAASISAFATAVPTPTIVAASKTIAMTTLQKTAVAAALAAAIGVALYQAHEASTLRSRLQAMQQTLVDQGQTLANERDETGRRISSLQEENRRLSQNLPELLKLRGEVNGLRREAVKLSQAVPEKPPTTDIPANAPSFQTFSASNHVALQWGQTLAVGGWKIPSGNRVLIFATPKPGDDATQLKIQIKVAEFDGENLTALGADSLATDTSEAKASLLESQQYGALVKALVQSGLSTVRDSTIISFSGQQAAIEAGSGREDTGTINLLPTISADGATVDMNITSTLNYPTTTTNH